MGINTQIIVLSKRRVIEVSPEIDRSDGVWDREAGWKSRLTESLLQRGNRSFFSVWKEKLAVDKVYNEVLEVLCDERTTT